MEKFFEFLMSGKFLASVIALAAIFLMYKDSILTHRNKSEPTNQPESPVRPVVTPPNGNQGQSTLSELEKIGLKIAMFLVILGIIFVTKWFFKSQGGVKNVAREIIAGEKTREEIVADSIQKIADAAKDAEKARKRAEDEYIADEYGMFGSLKNDFLGKNTFRGKSDSEKSEDQEDLTNSVPSNKTDGNSKSSTSVSTPDPAVIAEQERMRKLLEHQNTDPQGKPIVPVVYPTITR